MRFLRWDFFVNGNCILFLSQDLTVWGTIVSLNGIKKMLIWELDYIHIILQNIKLISISYMKKYDTGRQYYLVSSMFWTSVICILYTLIEILLKLSTAKYWSESHWLSGSRPLLQLSTDQYKSCTVSTIERSTKI